MLSIINVLTGMKNITLNETANLIYTHRDKKNPDGFSSFKVEVSNPLLYTPVEDLSKSDIKLYSCLVSEYYKPEARKCIQLCNAVSFFESEKKYPWQRKKGCFQFQLKDAESHNYLMNELSRAGRFNKLVFFRITGLPSKDPTQAPTTADCSIFYGTETSNEHRHEKLITSSAKEYHLPRNSESTTYNGVHKQKSGTENTEPPLKVPIKGEMPVITSNPGSTENSKPPVKPDEDENSKPPVRLDEDENSKPPVKPDGDENSKPPVKPEVNEHSNPPVKLDEDEDSNLPLKPEVNDVFKPPVKPEVNEDSKPPVKPEVNEDSKPPVSTEIPGGDENTVNHEETDVLGSNSAADPPSERNFLQKYGKYFIYFGFGILGILGIVFTLWIILL